MQRLFNMLKWQLLENGSSVNFSNTEVRRVRIDVNAPDPVKLFYSDGDGKVTFLAVVHGRDKIEFGAYGEFAITVDGGDVWFDTVDGEDFSFAIPDAVIITKIAERRVRNPEFELMQYKMNQNLEARMRQQTDELERRWALLAKAIPAPATVAPPPSGHALVVEEPSPAAGANVIDPSASGADGRSGAAVGAGAA